MPFLPPFPTCVPPGSQPDSWVTSIVEGFEPPERDFVEPGNFEMVGYAYADTLVPIITGGVVPGAHQQIAEDHQRQSLIDAANRSLDRWWKRQRDHVLLRGSLSNTSN
jgi:hypothetical protein